MLKQKYAVAYAGIKLCAITFKIKSARKYFTKLKKGLTQKTSMEKFELICEVMLNIDNNSTMLQSLGNYVLVALFLLHSESN